MTGAPSRRYRVGTDGVTINVKVQPKSRRPGLQGWAADIDGERLRIGVTEAADDGRANRAACAALAEALSLPASAVAVIQGATSRQKTIRIMGEVVQLTGLLEALP